MRDTLLTLIVVAISANSLAPAFADAEQSPRFSGESASLGDAASDFMGGRLVAAVSPCPTPTKETPVPLNIPHGAKVPTSTPNAVRPKSTLVPPPWVLSLSNVKSDVASAEAVALARNLKLVPSFNKLSALRAQLQSAGDPPPQGLRSEVNDARQELTEAIEQTRLEIDYAQAELSVEIAGSNELVQMYTTVRDHRVAEANLWAFRSNGVLWAAAEGLSIPTYSHPKYAISAGTIGIIAGLLPSAVSVFALKETSKGGRFDREPRPNMLAPLFGYPSDDRLDFPASVWNYIHNVPLSEPGEQTRFQHLVNRWIEDKNIRVFSDTNSRGQLDAITGTVQKQMTLDLLTDRLNMLQQLSAVINQMNRPLLELMMVVRGTKHFDNLTEQ